jgi:MscS family membrane protein
MDFLNYTFLDNTISNLLMVLGTILLVSISRRWLSRNLASLLYIPIQKKWKSVEKKVFIGLVLKPLGSFLTVLIAMVALANLKFPTLFKFHIYSYSFDEMLHIAGKCLTIFYFIWVVRSFIDFISLVLESSAKSNKDKSNDQLIVFFRDFLKAIVFIIGFLLVLKIGFRVDIGALLTGLSIVGAALALAAKESIENLIASFIIFFDKPFDTGDMVKVNNISNTSGTIEHIGLRSTRIRTADHTMLSVPNKQMVDSVVDNWSQRDVRRAEIKIEFSIAISTDKIQTFIETINSFLASKKTTINNHSVYLTDINKSSLIVTIEYFTSAFSMDLFLNEKQEINLYIKSVIEKQELKLAIGEREV